MQAVHRFHWDSAEYSEAFATLLRCTRGREGVRRRLSELCARYPAESHAIDWGAGGGDLTRLLLEHFRYVHALEPNAAMRAELGARCPRAHVMSGSLLSSAPPVPVAVGLVSHVLYHVPEDEWPACVEHAARHLAADGVLVVTLKASDSECNAMLEHFGAPRFDLTACLGGLARLRPDLEISFERIPAFFVTSSFDDTLTIARFMLCDRGPDAFSRQPSESEFRDYVRQRFWNEADGTGGWRYDEQLGLVRRC